MMIWNDVTWSNRFISCRYDYENVATEGANQMMHNLREMVANNTLLNKQYGEYIISQMDDFKYVDPIDESVSEKQVNIWSWKCTL